MCILQIAKSWINVFTKTLNIRKIKQGVKVYELRLFDFFLKTSFQQYVFLQNRQRLDKN